ncbi:MAG: nitroreductase [Parasporobacterium sp.]|nr:nitroreductase [Parasporobacterium sp.]
MSILEQIRHRRSVRTFDGEEMKQEDLNGLLEFADTIKNPYGLPVKYKILKAKEHGLSSPVLHGEYAYLFGMIKQVPHAEEAFGFSFEQLILHADALGIGTVWIAGTMDRKQFEEAAGISEGEVLPCISPLGYYTGKQSLKEHMMRKAIKADSRAPFEELFFRHDLQSPLKPEEIPDYKDVLEMVRWAPSAVNKQPWRVIVDGMDFHFYEKHSKGYIDASGWDLQKIDLGIAMSHFDLGIKEQGKIAEFRIGDPSLADPEELEYIGTFQIK